ncbi:MAG: hypothetical protein ACREM2_05125 [Vulcanimicrobiaceae bacterium]
MEPADPSPALRPLGLGEILDRAVTLTVRRFPFFAAIYVLFQLPYAFAQYEFNRGALPMLSDLVRTGGRPSDPARVQAILAESHVGPMLAVVVVIAMLFGPLVFAALVYAVSATYLGKNPSYERAIRAGVGRWLPLLGVYLLAFAAAFLIYVLLALLGGIVLVGVASLAAASKGLAIAIGFIAGTVFFLALFALVLLAIVVVQLASFICIVEAVAAPSALGLAVARVRTTIGIRRSLRFGAIYLLIAIGGALVSALGSTALIALVRSTALALAFASLVSIAMAIFLCTVVAIYYFDLRVREEGLDLALAAEALAQTAS